MPREMPSLKQPSAQATDVPLPGPTDVPIVATPAPVAQWVQVGNDIHGEAPRDEAGVAVALSSNGAVVAVGAYLNDGGGDGAGHVRVYGNTGGGWQQRGSDLDGSAPRSFSGWAVALSADGTILAVGAYGTNGGNGEFSGQAKVFIWNGNFWEDRGQPIDGDAADWLGNSVALSADGTILAVGAISAGYVRVFSWTGTAWNQRGNDLEGLSSNDLYGDSVSLSSDGSIVACGAVRAAGYVQVFRWSGSSWLQQTPTLRGLGGSGDAFGSSVSLSGDGSMLAIGASHGSYVVMYRNDGTSWFQIGQIIHGATADDLLGIFVRLSSAGDTVVIGGNKNDSGGFDSGHALVYRLAPDRDEWVRVGQELIGEAAGDNFGRSVAISDNGTRIAVGGNWNDGNGFRTGHVRVFDLQ